MRISRQGKILTVLNITIAFERYFGYIAVWTPGFTSLSYQMDIIFTKQRVNGMNFGRTSGSLHKPASYHLCHATRTVLPNTTFARHKILRSHRDS